jgi:hypothetical protein
MRLKRDVSVGVTYISFHHEKREFNVEAHRPARMALTLPAGRYLWLVEPLAGLNMHATLNLKNKMLVISLRKK